MKRLLSAALALSLIGTTAAQAGSFGNYGYQDGHYDRYSNASHFGHDSDRDHRYRHHDDTGAVIAVGVGLIALTAILASQHDRARPEAREIPADYGPRDYGRPGYDQPGYGRSDQRDDYGPHDGYAPGGSPYDQQNQYGQRPEDQPQWGRR